MLLSQRSQFPASIGMLIKQDSVFARRLTKLCESWLSQNSTEFNYSNWHVINRRPDLIWGVTDPVFSEYTNHHSYSYEISVIIVL